MKLDWWALVKPVILTLRQSTGTDFESISRSVQIGWQFACGTQVDSAEVRTCLAEVADVVAFYHEEEIGILGNAATVILRVLQSLSDDEEESLLAVARGLLTTLDTSQAAESMANQGIPREQRSKVAVAEEKAWQDQAIPIVCDWQGVAARNMFDSIAENPPLWLSDWLKRSKR